MGDLGSNATLRSFEVRTDSLQVPLDSTQAMQNHRGDRLLAWPLVLLSIVAGALAVRLLFTKR